MTFRWLRKLPLLTRTLLVVTAGLAITLTVLGFLSVRALQESTERALAERLRQVELVAAYVDHRVGEALRLPLPGGSGSGRANPEGPGRILRTAFSPGKARPEDRRGGHH